MWTRSAEPDRNSRRLEPEEVALLAVFLASDDARMITGQAYNGKPDVTASSWTCGILAPSRTWLEQSLQHAPPADGQGAVEAIVDFCFWPMS